MDGRTLQLPTVDTTCDLRIDVVLHTSVTYRRQTLLLTVKRGLAVLIIENGEYSKADMEIMKDLVKSHST